MTEREETCYVVASPFDLEHLTRNVHPLFDDMFGLTRHNTIEEARAEFSSMHARNKWVILRVRLQWAYEEVI